MLATNFYGNFEQLNKTKKPNPDENGIYECDN